MSVRLSVPDLIFGWSFLAIWRPMMLRVKTEVTFLKITRETGCGTKLLTLRVGQKQKIRNYFSVSGMQEKMTGVGLWSCIVL